MTRQSITAMQLSPMQFSSRPCDVPGGHEYMVPMGRMYVTENSPGSRVYTMVATALMVCLLTLGMLQIFRFLR